MDSALRFDYGGRKQFNSDLSPLSNLFVRHHDHDCQVGHTVNIAVRQHERQVGSLYVEAQTEILKAQNIPSEGKFVAVSNAACIRILKAIFRYFRHDIEVLPLDKDKKRERLRILRSGHDSSESLNVHDVVAKRANIASAIKKILTKQIMDLNSERNEYRARHGGLVRHIAWSGRYNLFGTRMSL